MTEGASSAVASRPRRSLRFHLSAVTAGLLATYLLSGVLLLAYRSPAPGIAAFAVGLVPIWLIYRSLGRPLHRLTDAVRAAGRDGRPPGSLTPTPVGPHAPAELAELAAALDTALAGHAAIEERLAHQALHDPLTGLPNQTLLRDRLGQALAGSRRSGLPTAVLFVDLDRFKIINDTLGHDLGNRVLQEVSRRLRASVRPTDTVARFGGDEFVVIAHPMTEGEAVELARRLIADVVRPLGAGHGIPPITASIGIALADGQGRAEHALRNADAAMYAAKDRGRGTLAVFSDRLRQRVTSRLLLENDLRDAIREERITVAYQPVIDLVSRAVVGVEALARWDHPELGPIPPTEFIPIAEDAGLVGELGRLVLRQACTQGAAWYRDGLGVRVSVNLSAGQLIDPTLPANLTATLAGTGLPPRLLSLELTESVLVDDAVTATAVLTELKRPGVNLSIDDFGTGYSSFTYLSAFPVDELKIDRSFIEDLPDNPDHRSLVGAMIAMSRALRLRVTAEGVEDDAQSKLLLDLGCDSAQGFLFGRPQPAGELTPMLQASARTISVAAAATRAG